MLGVVAGFAYFINDHKQIQLKRVCNCHFFGEFLASNSYSYTELLYHVLSYFLSLFIFCVYFLLQFLFSRLKTTAKNTSCSSIKVKHCFIISLNLGSMERAVILVGITSQTVRY